MFLFLISLISGWVVAASLMAEKANVGMAVFIADIIVRRKSHFKWNCCTDFFCQLILVHNGLRQYFPKGVQNFVQWHFLKSNMAAATSLNH